MLRKLLLLGVVSFAVAGMMPLGLWRWPLAVAAVIAVPIIYSAVDGWRKDKGHRSEGSNWLPFSLGAAAAVAGGWWCGLTWLWLLAAAAAGVAITFITELIMLVGSTMLTDYPL